MAMSSAQIRASLRKNGWTYERIGQLVEEGQPLSATMISRNVKKVAGHKSQRARKAIAKALGRDIGDVYGTAA